MVLCNQLILSEMVNGMNHELEQLCCTRRQGAHKETQNQDEVLLWDMLLAPSNEAVVCESGIQNYEY